jgi:hypothetical protein
VDAYLRISLADYGYHENQYSLGTLQTQKAISKVNLALVFSELRGFSVRLRNSFIPLRCVDRG